MDVSTAFVGARRGPRLKIVPRRGRPPACRSHVRRRGEISSPVASSTAGWIGQYGPGRIPRVPGVVKVYPPVDADPLAARPSATQRQYKGRIAGDRKN